MRFAFPECISGLYLPEEMGAPVSIVDGEVVPEQAGPPTPDMEDGPAHCDAVHWNKAWHAAVKGTRFEDDDTRLQFIAYHTQQQHDSLTGFLTVATEDQASALVASITRRIGHERAKLIAQLDEAIGQVRDMGGTMEMLSAAELAGMQDAEIADVLAHARKTIDVAESMQPVGATA